MNACVHTGLAKHTLPCDRLVVLAAQFQNMNEAKKLYE